MSVLRDNNRRKSANSCREATMGHGQPSPFPPHMEQFFKAILPHFMPLLGSHKCECNLRNPTVIKEYVNESTTQFMALYGSELDMLVYNCKGTTINRSSWEKVSTGSCGMDQALMCFVTSTLRKNTKTSPTTNG